MILITIENKGWGRLVVHAGKIKGARLQWQSGRDMQIYIKGAATDCYDLMAVVAIEEAAKRGIKASTLRCQEIKRGGNFTSKTRSMF